MIEQVLHSRKTITPQGISDVYVLIRDGLIAGVVDQLPSPPACGIEELGDSILMAGIVDPHVHINEPGRTEWEGFDTASRAALAGGITTMVDMPLNSSPVTTSVEAFQQKLEASAGKLHTNISFWGGLVPGNSGQVEPLIAAGVTGFKAFLTHSGIDEFPNVTEDDLRKAMPVLARHRLPLLVHCELSDDQGLQGDPRSYSNYLASRPRRWEDQAIALMIRLCEEFNCPVHIVHLSSADSLDQIAAAKQKGLPLTVETAQHYLFFTAEEIRDGDTVMKCAPPIRERENNLRLWQGLKEGIIDFVATDHSPAPPALKETSSGNFIKAWGGIASLQFALPALWTAARLQGCGPERMAGWLCEKPAALIGREARIETGQPADLVCWDAEASFTVTEAMIQHRHKLTPYLDRQLQGVVEATWLQGTKAYAQGKFLHLNKGKHILND